MNSGKSSSSSSNADATAQKARDDGIAQGAVMKERRLLKKGQKGHSTKAALYCVSNKYVQMVKMTRWKC